MIQSNNQTTAIPKLKQPRAQNTENSESAQKKPKTTGNLTQEQLRNYSIEEAQKERKREAKDTGYLPTQKSQTNSTDLNKSKTGPPLSNTQPIDDLDRKLVDDDSDENVQKKNTSISVWKKN